PNSLKGRNATMQDLASYLSGVDGRQVLDRTGLAGRYDFTLESLPGPDNPLSSLKGLKLAPPPENGVSLFTALKEQLGLELESAKGPVEILVIDHVEKPSEN